MLAVTNMNDDFQIVRIAGWGVRVGASVAVVADVVKEVSSSK
jgi:hypothetical protein